MWRAYSLCNAQKSTPVGYARDELWRIRDIQFDNPQVRINAAAAHKIILALFARKIIGRTDCAPLAIEIAFQQRTFVITVAALNQKGAAIIIPACQHHGMPARRVDGTKHQIDNQTGGKPHHAASRASFSATSNA
jgi:hypothetical protein